MQTSQDIKVCVIQEILILINEKRLDDNDLYFEGIVSLTKQNASEYSLQIFTMHLIAIMY